MSRDSPLNVAAALTVPPLDQGSVIAGHRGLTHEVLWVDIIHAPAGSFVRAHDLVLTTDADIRQADVREFLAYLVASPAAGLIISPPPELAAGTVRDLLSSLVSLADRHEFPVVLLPWEIAFADVQKSLLPLLSPSIPGAQVEMAIGRREGDNDDWTAGGWAEFADSFVKALHELALAAGVTVRSSVTDDLVMSHFSSAASESAVSGLVESAQRLSGVPENLVSWVLLPPAHGQAVTVAASIPSSVPDGPVGPRQFAEVLRQTSAKHGDHPADPPTTHRLRPDAAWATRPHIGNPAQRGHQHQRGCAGALSEPALPAVPDQAHRGTHGSLAQEPRGPLPVGGERSRPSDQRAAIDGLHPE